MNDPWNARKDELLDWAGDPDSPWPTKDFDLAVAELEFADEILALAVDTNCPKKPFFLKCAYLLVGDAVMTQYKTRSKSDVRQFIAKAKAAGGPDMDAFHERAVALMSDPSLFDYDLWCDGGFIKS